MFFSHEAVATLIILIIFISTHIFGWRLHFLDIVPRSRWLSIAGGVSIAYVFIYLLPELATILGEHVEFAKKYENFTFIAAFIGLLTFYGLEKLSRRKSFKKIKFTKSSIEISEVFWLHIISFSIYNFLICYLLFHHISNGWIATLTYGFALALHLLVIDKSLRDSFGTLYHKYGRWILSFSLVFGWLTGIFVWIAKLWVDLLLAFLAGGIILNVLKEELPAERESSYFAFLFGAVIYGLILYLVS